MSTFVLVHGAYLSSAYWDDVAKILRSNGHDVFAPSLTGSGERAHQLTPSVSLRTHVTDIRSLLEYRDLNDVILVGHSYSGYVVTGAALEARERVGRLVYADAVVPEPGKTCADVLGDPFGGFVNAANKNGDGWRMPLIEGLDVKVGVEGEVRARFNRLITPFSLLCFKQRIEALSEGMGVLDEFAPVYIFATKDYPNKVLMQSSADRAREYGWTVEEIDAAHMSALEVPAVVAQRLLALA
ncbi:MAG: alpha/beta hydrolase [Myxococcota bacterium]